MQRQLAFALACLLTAALPVAAAPVRVTGRIAAPVPAGVRIDLLPAFVGYDDALRLLAGGPEPPPLVSAQPLADGSFELFAPEEGLFRIRVQASGRLTVEQGPLPLIEEAVLPPVRLEAASEAEVTVLGPEGKPLPGIRFLAVRAQAADASEGHTGWTPAFETGRLTSEDGKLRLPARADERIGLWVLAPAFLGQEAGAQAGRRETIRLPARPLRTVEVRGRDGKPVAGAVLWWSSWPIAATGPDGRLRLFVPPSGVLLTLEGPAGLRAELAFHPEESGTATKVVTLSGSPPSVSGRVLDAATRAPLPGALVWAERSWVRAGADGGFHLPLPLEPQTSFQAAAPAHVQLFVPRQSSDPPDITVLLEPAGSIFGQVVDPEGRPVDGVQLVAMPTRTRFTPEGRAWTGPDGSFRFHSLPAGETCEITVTREGFAPASQTAQPPSPGRPSPPLRIVLSRGTTAAGKVVDEAGTPLPGVTLALLPSMPGGARFAGPMTFDLQRGRSEATSDAAGTFRFRNLVPGRFDLWVEHPGFSPALLPGLEVPDPPGEADLGVVTLQAGVAIEGRVTDARGTPVEGAWVQAPPSSGGSEAAWRFQTRPREPFRTGPDGRFRLTDLARGKRFDLMVSHERYAPVQLPGVEAPTLQPLRIEVRELRRLEGRVLDPEGRPVAGAEVSTFSENETSFHGSTFSGRSWSGERPTDQDGRFSLPLEAAEISIAVTARGYRPKLVRGLRLPEDGAAAPVEIVLERGAVLEGRVVNGHGEPAAGARLAAHAMGGALPFSQIEDRTDAEGGYRLEGLELGTYDVTAEDGEQHLQRTVEVRPGVNRLDLSFDRGVEVSGQVTDEQGTPLVSAHLSLRPVQSGRGYSTMSGADGRFVFPAVADGDFRLSGSGPGFAHTQDPREVHITGRPVGGLELRLARGGRIVGSLLGLPADEVAGARIEALGEGPGTLLHLFGTVGPGNRYEIPEVTPGTWRVLANVSPDRRAEGSVEVTAAGEDTVLDLQFATGLTLSGRILLDGKPLPGAELMVISQPQSSTRQASTWYDGSFEIGGLQPGTWQLFVTPGAGLGYVQSLDLASDQEMSIEIVTGSASGQVLTATGSPVPGALVSLRGGNPAAETSFVVPALQTDDQGAFEFPRLAAGSYLLKAEKEGFAPEETSITVTPGGTVQVQVVLEP